MPAEKPASVTRSVSVQVCFTQRAVRILATGAAVSFRTTGAGRRGAGAGAGEGSVAGGAVAGRAAIVAVGALREMPKPSSLDFLTTQRSCQPTSASVAV